MNLLHLFQFLRAYTRFERACTRFERADTRFERADTRFERADIRRARLHPVPQLFLVVASSDVFKHQQSWRIEAAT